MDSWTCGGNLDLAKIERMMAALGTGEVALLARQRRLEKLAERIQRVVPGVALLVLHEGMQRGDGDRIAIVRADIRWFR